MESSQAIGVCAQENLTDCHEGIQVLEGALNKAKCHWYWVALNRKGGKWGYTPLHRLNGELEIYTSIGKWSLIRKYG